MNISGDGWNLYDQCFDKAKENEINDIEKLLEKIENDDDVQNVYHTMN